MLSPTSAGGDGRLGGGEKVGGSGGGAKNGEGGLGGAGGWKLRNSSELVSVCASSERMLSERLSSSNAKSVEF